MAAISVPVRHEGEAGEARRVAVALAGRLGFDEEARGRVALVVTEAAHNIARHARQGEVVVTPLDRGGVGGIEVLALDKGPGMADVERCLRDGYSTAGTAGKGLGAITRLADSFDIYSLPGQGTAVLARLWAGPRPSQPAEPLEIGDVNIPMVGEEVCGDGWAVVQGQDRVRVLVVDGLGHGPGAATAALEATRTFHQYPRQGPAELLRTAHSAMRATRGAAAAVAEIDLVHREIHYAGVGNIVAVVIDGEKRHNMVSLNGTVGHQVMQVQEFVYPWPPGALLVMHSDGVGTQWRLDRYPGLAARCPSLVAGVLYKDFNRGRDDSTILVARDARGDASA